MSLYDLGENALVAQQLHCTKVAARAFEYRIYVVLEQQFDYNFYRELTDNFEMFINLNSLINLEYFLREK